MKNLPNGNYSLRIITLPFQYYEHQIFSKNKDKIYQIRCSIATGSCRFCHCSYKPNRMWLIGTINRDNNEYQEYIVNYKQFSMVRDLYKTFGNPEEYDIKFSVDATQCLVDIGSREPVPGFNKDLMKELVDFKDKVKPSPVSCTTNLYNRYKDDLGEVICSDQYEM